MQPSTTSVALLKWADSLRSTLDHLRTVVGMDGWWGGVLFALVLLHVVARIAVAHTGRRPAYLLDLKELQHEWASSTWYWKVFMPFLSLFVLGYLAVAWAVHGAQVLLELVVKALHLVLQAVLWLWTWFVWLLGKLWWALQWIWREVIDVTIVLLLKLVWHYLFVWSYRFLHWCLHKAFAGYTWTLLRAGTPHMLAAVFLVVLGTWASSLVGDYWPLGCLALPAYLVLLGGAGTVLHHADGQMGQPAWRMALYRHPMIWGLGALLAVGQFVLLGQVPLPGVRLVLWGLSLDIALVVVPLTFLLVFAFVSAAAMLPAHARAHGGKVELLPFAKAAAWRFLKYAAATPYKVLGIGIVSILPVVLGALLYAGITGATGLIGGPDPADQERLAKLEAAWQSARSSCTTVDQAKNVSGSCSDLMAARVQSGKAGITQGAMAWPEAITNAGRGVADASLTGAQLEGRGVLYRADSANAGQAVRDAKKALDGLEQATAAAATAARERPAADTAGSAALALELQRAYEQQVKTLRDEYAEGLKGAPEALRNELEAQLSVELARLQTELETELSRFSDAVSEATGAVAGLERAALAEAASISRPDERSLEDKAAAEEALNTALENAERVDTEWTLDVLELEDTISAIRWHNVRWIITGLLAAIAMSVFLSLVLLPGWTYNVLKNAELYGYHEEGATYAQEIVGGHRARDERQPVMGWIILMLLSVLLWFGALSQFGSTAWASILNFAKANWQQVEAAPPPQAIIAPVVADTVAVEPEPIDTLGMDPEKDSTQEAEAFLLGAWVGEMGGKPLRIVIERVVDGRLEGYNVLGPARRPIKGPYNTGPNLDACGFGFEAALAEPGDDRWDGVFRLQFLGAHGTTRDEDGLIVCDRSYLEYARASGEWRSNNGKLQRTFIVTKEGESTYSEMELRNMEYSEDEGLLTEPVSTEDVIREQSVNLSADEQVFTIVEEMPSFPGGEAELFKYLGRNLNYPQTARNDGVSGVVYLTFVVEKNGRLRDAKVLRGIGGGCDEEAVRVVSTMPAWKPGRQSGRPVNVQYNLPIRFSLR
jgi:TonB family protein